MRPTAHNPQLTTHNLQPTTDNPLFPVFLKLEKLDLLLVGGGNIALEKLGALLANSPDARIKLVATEISPAVKDVLLRHDIPYQERAFAEQDTENTDLAIIAINDHTLSRSIHAACRQKGILTNVADTPELCDFYLGSVVQKGSLKIAISTNGKSPTIAKRVKDTLQETFPDEIDAVLENMEKIRNTLKGDFSDKVKHLNEITRVLAPKDTPKKSRNIPFLQVILIISTVILLMYSGYLLFSTIL